MSELLDRITINPAVRSGKPVICGPAGTKAVLGGMKLLFDENLSFRLVAALADIYPKRNCTYR